MRLGVLFVWAWTSLSPCQRQPEVSQWARRVSLTAGSIFRHPPGWSARQRVLSTEFSRSASCESAVAGDFVPPPDSSAAFVFHSFVQICQWPVNNALTLDACMRKSCGREACGTV
jgi:hypothetical protein